jgi:DNA-directed RNA polymerase specialized sigma24 family protein
MESDNHDSKQKALNQEDFNRFLVWLDPDREAAGQKYEDIRVRLTKLFFHRGCFAAEELADETIDRVIKKISQIDENYVGDKASYFYGVAHKIYLESLRKRPTDPPSFTEIYTGDDNESESRELILEYYCEEKQQKIDRRKEMASRLGIPLNTLRMRAYRIKRGLYECMIECLKKHDVS